MQQQLAVPAVKNEAALQELGRFFKLSVELRKPLTMFSGYVDAAWHEMEKEPGYFAEFCARTAGQPIGHVPSGPGPNPIVEIEWLNEYEAKYGPLPEMWFADEDGTINDVLYGIYRRTGRVQDAWRCNPSTGSTGTAE